MVELFDSMDLDGNHRHAAAPALSCSSCSCFIQCVLGSYCVRECVCTTSLEFSEFLTTVVHMGIGTRALDTRGGGHCAGALAAVQAVRHTALTLAPTYHRNCSRGAPCIYLFNRANGACAGGAERHLVLQPVKTYARGPAMATSRTTSEHALRYLPQLDRLLCVEARLGAAPLCIRPLCFRWRQSRPFHSLLCCSTCTAGQPRCPLVGTRHTADGGEDDAAHDSG